MNNEEPPNSEDEEEPTEEYARITSIKSTKLGFFDRVLRSFRNLDFYGLVFVETGKQAFFYTLKLCLLVGFLSGLVFGLSNWSVVDRISSELQSQIPRITITRETVQTDVETPYSITLMDKYELLIDPDAKRNRKRLDTNVLMVLADGAVYVRNGEQSFEAWAISNYSTNDGPQEFVIDASTIQDWTQFFKWTLLIVSCIGLMIGYVIQGFLRVVLISAGGFFAADSDSDLFHWGSFFKISCYAVTPVIVADAFLFSLGLSLPYQELFLLGGGTFFVYFIVKHLSKNLKGVRVDLTDVDEDDPSNTEGSDSDIDK